MFGSCITDFITSNSLDNLINLTNAEGMFALCSKMTIKNIDGLFDKLVKLENLIGMFNKCKSLIINPVPEGLLAKCNSLQNASGLFSECSGVGGIVPVNLFYKNEGEQEYKCSSLTDISGMFCGTSLSGRLKKEFFK